MKKIHHINYALVESVRPPMYKAMKYWGKKPHNIWRQFIEAYSDKDESVLDPFSGSAVAAFEAVKSHRKAFAFDLNPITSFIIESTCSKFDELAFIDAFKKIEEVVISNDIYINNYLTIYNGENAVIYNYKWEDNSISKVALKTTTKSFIITPTAFLKNMADAQNEILIPFWFPTDSFPQNPSITYKFIKDIGGDSFDNLWTKRNLYILALIFDLIIKQKDENIKLQLLSGFIQTLHLCSKMVVPRDSKSNRDFSGSWGRADYMIRRRSMEQNPLIVFKRACIEKQGVLPALKNFAQRFPNGIKIFDAKANKKINKSADINYGILDVADLLDLLPENSIDFVITDPPYAGLVYYMDLSLIWLVWLKKIYPKYTSDIRSEITIKKGYIERVEYKRRLENAFKNIHKVLKDDGFLIVTFHHKKIEEWNDFVRAVKYAGFKFDKITHQYNKRSGESNVSNPYGTSGADFYIRCVKHREVDFSDDKSGLAHFIKQKTIDVLAERNQPTPESILISALIPELLQAGFFQPDEYKNEIERILNLNCGEGKPFRKWDNKDNKAGSYWWFNNPSEFINFPDLPLDRRVEDLVLSILRSKISVKFDDIIGHLFRTFPNGLTPDPRGIVNILGKYAYKSSEKWKIKEETIQSMTQHTLIIEYIIKAGKKSGYQTFVGRREQPEITSNGNKLANLSDLVDLKNVINVKSEILKRIEMIDSLWLNSENKDVECVFEVENSTDFTSAIQRASNLPFNIPKFMIIPEYREKELCRIRDPYFLEGFNIHNWRYLTFEDIKKISSYSKVSIYELINTSKKISINNNGE